MKYIDFKVGADPEFGAFNKTDGSFVSASDIIPESIGRRYDSQLGLDGNTSIFEIRPKADVCPFMVVKDIKKIFNKYLDGDDLKYFDFRAGSIVGGHSIGGHIHLEIPKDSNDSVPYNMQIANFCNKHINKLCNYIAFPLSLLESRKNRVKRINKSYGRLYDYREQPYGLEIRAASSWLSSPHAAASALCLAKMVHFELLNNPKFEFAHFKVNAEQFKSEDISRLVEIFNSKVWPDLQKMLLYKAYKKQIDLIKYLIDNKLTWHTKHDLRSAWGLKPSERFVYETITFESIWEN